MNRPRATPANQPRSRSRWTRRQRLFPLRRGWMFFPDIQESIYGTRAHRIWYTNDKALRRWRDPSRKVKHHTFADLIEAIFLMLCPCPNEGIWIQSRLCPSDPDVWNVSITLNGLPLARGDIDEGRTKWMTSEDDLLGYIKTRLREIMGRIPLPLPVPAS